MAVVKPIIGYMVTKCPPSVSEVGWLGFSDTRNSLRQ
jgi:hypothetical protein